MCKPFIYNEIEQGNDCLRLQWDPETELKSRIKVQRLTDNEKNEYWKKVLNWDSDKDLKELYQISQSTIHRFVRRREIKILEQSGKTPIKVRALNNRSIWKMIALFIKNVK